MHLCYERCSRYRFRRPWARASLEDSGVWGPGTQYDEPELGLVRTMLAFISDYLNCG